MFQTTVSEPIVAIDLIARQIIDAAFSFHKTPGPGLLESVYEHCFTHELSLRGVPTQSQVSLPGLYKGLHVDADYGMDLVIADLVVVEIKAVDKVLPVHQAQLLTYLKLSGLQLGLLINFNEILIKDGIRRLMMSR